MDNRKKIKPETLNQIITHDSVVIIDHYVQNSGTENDHERYEFEVKNPYVGRDSFLNGCVTIYDGTIRLSLYHLGKKISICDGYELEPDVIPLPHTA